MKSTTYIVEITNQKDEKYLSEGRNPLACSPAGLVSARVSEFTEKCLCDLSHMVSAAPIFLGIFFYHSFYGMTLRFLPNQGEGVHF